MAGPTNISTSSRVSAQPSRFASPSGTPQKHTAASGTIPKRLGYAHECTRARRYVDCNGDRHDLEAYVMFREKFADSPSVNFDYEALDALGNRL